MSHFMKLSMRSTLSTEFWSRGHVYEFIHTCARDKNSVLSVLNSKS